MMNPSDTKLVFLTGSTGLLGGHLLVHLHRSGKKVRCLIRSSSSFSQLEQICSFYGESFEVLKSSVEWVIGNTLDYVGLTNWMNGVDEVYHCAAIVSFNSKDRERMLRTNIQGTANMVDAVLRGGVRCFCYISSIASLGKTPDKTPITEDTPRKNDEPTSSYSESKFRSELEVWRGIGEGLNAVIVNPGVILGPGELGKGSMLLIQAGMKGIPFYTKASTGYVDVRDVCRASVELMGKGIFGKRFILVSENVHNGILFGLIAQEFGKKAPRHEAGRLLLQGGVFASNIWGFLTGKTPQLTKDTIRSAQNPETYSNARIRQILDFEFISLTQTIKDTCDFLKKHWH
jgi:dihydroflavonol-4-reductase